MCFKTLMFFNFLAMFSITMIISFTAWNKFKIIIDFIAPFQVIQFQTLQKFNFNHQNSIISRVSVKIMSNTMKRQKLSGAQNSKKKQETEVSIKKQKGWPFQQH